MEDRELLELAAKAAGFVFNNCKIDGALWGCFEGAPSQVSKPWNPLENDGDALRLAAKLRMYIEPARTMGGAFVEVHAHPSGRGDCAGVAPLGGDDNAATRRAIVLAAAEIGRTM